jgi:hypothetical protein
MIANSFLNRPFDGVEKKQEPEINQSVVGESQHDDQMSDIVSI